MKADRPRVCVGIDVGAGRLHCVALDEHRRLVGAWLFTTGELDRLVAAVGRPSVVMVDAPAQLSTLPHDRDDRLSRKFQKARCAEIALGRDHGSWVPWVAPADPPEGGWIAAGLELYAALRAHAVPAFEVFPFAGYRALANGRALPKKSTAAGVRARVELLAEAGVRERDLPMWSHDALDALLAALIGVDQAEGRARRVTCGHDDSAIWLPAA